MDLTPIRCLIPELEEERKLEPYQVYETIGMIKQQYSSYRTGRKLPSITTAKLIAEFFGVPIDDLHEWPEIIFPQKQGGQNTE